MEDNRANLPLNPTQINQAVLEANPSVNNKYTFRLTANPGKIQATSRTYCLCKVCPDDPPAMDGHLMQYVLGRCPNVSCGAKFRVRRCQKTGREDFFSTQANHDCVLPSRGPVIGDEQRAAIIAMRKNHSSDRTIEEAILARFPTLTAVNVQSVLRGYRRQAQEGSTVEQVRAYIGGYCLNRELGVNDPFPFFFGDSTQGHLGTGSANSHLRINITSKSWLRRLADYQNNGGPLTLAVDGTYKVQKLGCRT